MSLAAASATEKIGFAVVRVIVPLWVLSGALMKLISATPKLLPKNIWTNALEMGADLYVLLFVLIGLELFAVAVMALLPRLAKPMAIWMLGLFCLILIWEIASGNDKCGCLGSFSPSPWVMLGIDGTLLLLSIALRPWRERDEWLPKGRVIAVALLTLIGFGVTGAVILPERTAGQVDVNMYVSPADDDDDDGGDGDGGDGDAGGAASGTAAGGTSSGSGSAGETRTMRLPPYLAVTDLDEWTGRRFLDTELAGLVQNWPDDLEMGPHYVIFYSRSCDHCQQLLETHFAANASVPTTLVAIPESKRGFNESTWLDMSYCETCVKEVELPVGVDYLVTPPLVVALAEGEVQCAAEESDVLAPQCLIFG